MMKGNYSNTIWLYIVILSTGVSAVWSWSSCSAQLTAEFATQSIDLLYNRCYLSLYYLMDYGPKEALNLDCTLQINVKGKARSLSGGRRPITYVVFLLTN